ncbi:MAG TPA: DUF2147 domain-containing protein [Stellaceae bacterium]|nr:DUF2147 domain-containing protein [Stellaceae bacterium]
MIRSVVAAAIMVILAVGGARAESSVDGRWLSQSGNGVVEIYPCGAKHCGKLVWLKMPQNTDENNPNPEYKKRRLCGLVILGDFVKDGDEWVDGWIYSPENGKTYSAKMRLDAPDILKLRGYVGISLFGETQTWTRADPKLANCGS